MYVVVPICFFCEKVLDGDSASGQRWVPLKDYRAQYGLLAQEVWASHTECPSCNGQYARFIGGPHVYTAMPPPRA
jgi:hypothetical protein